jgi:hypothetical protein
MSLRDAKDLHADITKLLLALQELHNTNLKNNTETPIVVQVSGGSFQ